MKSKAQSLKLLVLSFSFTLCTFHFTLSGYAKEITILYTGETHAMLYPCNCPKEADGGVARRATLVKKLRKNNPDTLLLDSGAFFSGGLMDEYTQNVPLDMQRASINLKAMELMRYDALNLGDDEFNFGREFLEENLKKTDLAILSCNIFTSTSSGMKRRLFRPYMIKEFRDIKIGIIGVTTVSTREKATGLEFIEPKTAVQEAIQELRKYNNIDIIIVLSHLGESEDLNLINDVDGIDILIIGHSRAKEEPFTKIGRTLILRPSWQGRKLGKLSLILKDKKIVDYKVEDLRLSEQIKDDPQVLSILPRCFSDNNCKEGSRIGVCHDPGTLKSRCEFGKVSKVSLLVITSKQCRVCDTQRVIRNLKTTFANLTISYLYYPKPEASKLIDDFGIDTLPVYLLGKEARQEKGFNNLRDNLESKGDFYLLKPQFSGISYFLKRPKLKDRLDLFISLYDKDTPELLAVAKVFRPNVHFLVTEEKNSFTAARGNLEVEEDLRSVCVQKYYPQSFYNYISCRGKFINSSWWEDCLENLDKQEIKTCAKGEVGRALLKENIRLNQELEIMRGPTYLLDNQEVFSLHSVPKREELEAIIQK